MDIYKYCIDVIFKLENSENFAKTYVDEKMKFFNIYQRKDNIILSSSHGIDFFYNLVKYYDNPDTYIEIPRDSKNKPIGDLKYENNFKKLINIWKK